jgi:prepilin-type N-terminal cleavage/methylation domain-containing protein
MKLSKRAFTLIELLIVIAVLAVLMSILMPSLRRTMEIAKERACMANAHSLQNAVLAYENDWDTYPVNQGTPNPLTWVYHTNNEAGMKGGAFWRGGYIQSPGAYRCPSDITNRPISYSMSTSVGLGRTGIEHISSYNYWFYEIHGFYPGNLNAVESTRQMTRPSDLLIFIEEGKWWDGGIMAWPLTYISGDSSPDAPVLRHYGNFVASFADGSVRRIPVISPRRKTGTETAEEQEAVSWWVYDHPQNLLPKTDVYIP